MGGHANLLTLVMTGHKGRPKCRKRSHREANLDSARKANEKVRDGEYKLFLYRLYYLITKKLYRNKIDLLTNLLTYLQNKGINKDGEMVTYDENNNTIPNKPDQNSTIKPNVSSARKRLKIVSGNETHDPGVESSNILMDKNVI